MLRKLGLIIPRGMACLLVPYQLWVIKSQVTESLRTALFDVGVFAGTSRPESANEFMTPLVNELRHLISSELQRSDF